MGMVLVVMEGIKRCRWGGVISVCDTALAEEYHVQMKLMLSICFNCLSAHECLVHRLALWDVFMERLTCLALCFCLTRFTLKCPKETCWLLQPVDRDIWLMTKLVIHSIMLLSSNRCLSFNWPHDPVNIFNYLVRIHACHFELGCPSEIHAAHLQVWLDNSQSCGGCIFLLPCLLNRKHNFIW